MSLKSTRFMAQSKLFCIIMTLTAISLSPCLKPEIPEWDKKPEKVFQSSSGNKFNFACGMNGNLRWETLDT